MPLSFLRHVFVLLVALASHILLVLHALCTISLSNLADLATSRLSAWRRHPPVWASGWCRAKMLWAPAPCWPVWRALRGSGARVTCLGCLRMRQRWRRRWRTWPEPRRRGRGKSSAHRSNSGRQVGREGRREATQSCREQGTAQSKDQLLLSCFLDLLLSSKRPFEVRF
jgi:hypothetical protein